MNIEQWGTIGDTHIYVLRSLGCNLPGGDRIVCLDISFGRDGVLGRK